MTVIIADQETLSWIAVTEQLPDVETTVLAYAPGCDEPVWLGYYDGVDWLTVDAMLYSEQDEIDADVTHWAAMPKGPS
jgi:hypothetical protein